ncbi:hypothetical protein CANCADRAFT_31141 [Tortispora caseinolytica NRRL Y-17796]|uniref:Zn(2)-C6 fungal-type domain-containing protein n=1 Tax=Tortispora caseinolytica NRRL Y-17796 TaxID=767744 RepID=A0A1E4TED1_9ASCO|nr:hypothetical protein CANCADRAFT_31141 [Tortispora caseinolytica NRRL Y-17796]
MSARPKPSTEVISKLTEYELVRKRLGRSVPRTKLGCITCKKRKVKCDLVKPHCWNCSRLGRTCVYALSTNAGSKTCADQLLSFPLHNSTDTGTNLLPKFRVEEYLALNEFDPLLQPDAEIGLVLTQKRQFLEEYFRLHVHPPIISTLDLRAWNRLKNTFLNLSQSQPLIAKAVCALSEVYSLSLWNSGKKSSTNFEGNNMIAFELYLSAKNDIELFSAFERDDKMSEHMLAASFLLGCFELICRDQLPAFTEKNMNSLLLKQGTKWSKIAKRLMSWLLLLDAKAVHLGGKGVLGASSSAMLAIVDDDRMVFNPSEWSDKESNLSESCTHRIEELKGYVFESLYKPIADFHVGSQGFVRRIATMDRHHIQRGVGIYEEAVQLEAENILKDMDKLWQQRSPLFDTTMKELSSLIEPALARSLYNKSRIILCNFWANYIYLHRVTWWDLPMSGIAMKAHEEIWNNLLKYYEIMETEWVPEYVPSKPVNPEFLWPMFMYGCEEPDRTKNTWVINEFRRATNIALPPDQYVFNNEFTYSMNASRAADLLEELIKRQKLEGKRIDAKFLSLELLGVEFSIL